MVTVTVYTRFVVPYLTVTLTVFVPSTHVAALPLVTVVVPFLISAVAAESTVLTVMVLVASVVVTV